MISLPMYDLDEIRPYTERLCGAIAARLADAGVDLPSTRERPLSLDGQWRDPDLVLSQSCGYPLLSLPSQVTLVATPCYDAPGCDGPNYRSALVVREQDPARDLADLRGRRCALNGWDSNSGMNLLRASVAPLAGKGRFFGEILVSGSHAASLAMIAGAAADVTAVDCVTLALLRRYRPASIAGLRVLDWTPDAPGLPLITAGGDPLRSALRAALRSIEDDPSLRPTLDALLINRFRVLPRTAYERIQTLEQEAIAAGYPALR